MYSYEAGLKHIYKLQTMYTLELLREKDLRKTGVLFTFINGNKNIGDFVDIKMLPTLRIGGRHFPT